jgi:hypothetical protein
VIVQFRKRDAFRIAIKLFVLLFVGHSTESTPTVGEAKWNRNRVSVPRTGALHEAQGGVLSLASTFF